MKYLKISLTFRQLLLILLCVDFLFIQCSHEDIQIDTPNDIESISKEINSKNTVKRSKDIYFEEFAEEIEKHFGGMNYSEVIVPEMDLSKLEVIKASEIVKSKSGRKLINISWFVLVNDKREIGGFYLGSDEQKENTTVFLTIDEARDRIARCKASSGSDNAYVSCINRLIFKIFSDCNVSTGENGDCWYTN